jgi:hypothetical protein
MLCQIRGTLPVDNQGYGQKKAAFSSAAFSVRFDFTNSGFEPYRHLAGSQRGDPLYP